MNLHSSTSLPRIHFYVWYTPIATSASRLAYVNNTHWHITTLLIPKLLEQQGSFNPDGKNKSMLQKK